MKLSILFIFLLSLINLTKKNYSVYANIPHTKQLLCYRASSVSGWGGVRATTGELRPWNCQLLSLESHISQHIEIVGFTDDNVDEYISKAFPDAAEKKQVLWVSTCSDIRSTMYIPIYYARVDCQGPSILYTHTQKTMTQIYTALVRELLVHYMESHLKGLLLGVSERLVGIFYWQRRVLFLKIYLSQFTSSCAPLVV